MNNMFRVSTIEISTAQLPRQNPMPDHYVQVRPLSGSNVSRSLLRSDFNTTNKAQRGNILFKEAYGSIFHPMYWRDESWVESRGQSSMRHYDAIEWEERSGQLTNRNCSITLRPPKSRLDLVIRCDENG